MAGPQTCPVCERELPPGAADGSPYPFCSPRCRQVDLYRWLTGRYAVVESLDPDRLARELDRQQPDEAGD